MTCTSFGISAANNPIHLFRAVRASIALTNPPPELKAEVEKTYVFSAVRGYFGAYEIFTVSGQMAGWDAIKRIRRLISSIEWTLDTPLMIEVLKLPYDGLSLTVSLIKVCQGKDPAKHLLSASAKVLRISIFLVPRTDSLLLSFGEAAIKTAIFFYTTYEQNTKAA